MAFVLEGTRIQSLDDLHEEVRSVYGFPEWYGRNLDGLWDLIFDLDPPVKTIWRDHQASSTAMGSDFDRVHKLFADAGKMTKDDWAQLPDNWSFEVVYD